MNTENFKYIRKVVDSVKYRYKYETKVPLELFSEWQNSSEDSEVLVCKLQTEYDIPVQSIDEYGAPVWEDNYIGKVISIEGFLVFIYMELCPLGEYTIQYTQKLDDLILEYRRSLSAVTCSYEGESIMVNLITMLRLHYKVGDTLRGEAAQVLLSILDYWRV